MEQRLLLLQCWTLADGTLLEEPRMDNTGRHVLVFGDKWLVASRFIRPELPGHLVSDAHGYNLRMVAWS